MKEKFMLAFCSVVIYYEDWNKFDKGRGYSQFTKQTWLCVEKPCLCHIYCDCLLEMQVLSVFNLHKARGL